MKRVAVSFGLGTALAIVLSGAQAALLRDLGGGRLLLDLPVVVLVWAGLQATLAEGVAAALGLGYVLDVFGGTPKGLLVFLSVLVLLGSRAARTSLAVHGRGGFAGLVGAGTTAMGAGALLLTRLTAPSELAPAAGLLWRVLLESVLTAAAAALLHPLLVRVERFLAREPEPGVLPG
jgi:hypothetical protein